MSDTVVAICGGVILALFFAAIVAAIYAIRPSDSRRAPTEDNPAFGSDTDEALPPGGHRRSRRGVPGFGRDGVIPSNHYRRRYPRRDDRTNIHLGAA
jgi:hypothetical protein